MKILLLPFHYIYSFWVVLIYFITAFIIFPFFFLFNILFEEYRAYGYILKVVKIWAAVWGFLCGIRYEVIDRHKLDRNKPYVFVCNHTSNVDSMIWGYSNDFLVKGLAKKELMKIPLVGYLFKTTCVIVDRSSPESRKASMQRLSEIAKRNVSIFFFPEGTRNKTDKPLQSFYDGAFRSAISLQLPIAPLLMCNANQVAPINSMLFKPGKVKCIFLDPIPTIGLTENDMEELKARVYKLMEEVVIKNDVRFSGKNN